MSIAESVAAATRYLTAHPEEARYRDSVARARADRGLAVVVTGPEGAEVRTDMPTSIGGANSAPSPGWLLRAAEASCLATLVMIRAAMVGLEVTSVEVEADSESDDRGILGLDDAVPAGPLTARVVVRLDAAGLSAEQRNELVRWAFDHCPVTDAVRRAVPMEVAIS